MLPEWADRTAEQIFGRGLVQTGIYLILGGVDTGKFVVLLWEILR